MLDRVFDQKRECRFRASAIYPAGIAAAAVIMAVTSNPMLAGFVSGFINTGNMEGAILGGISGAFFASAGAIGEQFGTLAGIAASGVAGGVMKFWGT